MSKRTKKLQLEPSPNFFCEPCKYNCDKKFTFCKHLQTAKHFKNVNLQPSDEIVINNVNIVNIFNTIDAEVYDCSHCNFTCNKKSHYDRHLDTKKHLFNVGYIKTTACKDLLYECTKCKKNYSNYKSFYSHKIKCKTETTFDEPIKPDTKNEDTKNEDTNSSNYIEIINKLLVDNQELRTFVVGQSQEMMKIMSEQNSKLIEMSKSNITNNNTINANINNHKFNINVFLNDHCKDAMNFPDFIESIDITHADLENNAQLGFVNGISKIILDNLKQLSIYERPIHCTDIKRETMYIKYDDRWNKEDNLDKLNSAIRDVSYKSISTLNQWKEANPEYQDINSEFSNKCMIISQNTLAGYNRDSYYPKVIKLISKEVALGKNITPTNE
jgi:hypothetical protein